MSCHQAVFNVAWTFVSGSVKKKQDQVWPFHCTEQWMIESKDREFPISNYSNYVEVGMLSNVNSSWDCIAADIFKLHSKSWKYLIFYDCQRSVQFVVLLISMQ